MTFADDAGEYSIFVKNPLGEESASASLLEEGQSVEFLFENVYGVELQPYAKLVFPIKVGISFITEEYEEYMKKHEMTYKSEVITTVQVDVPPVVVSEYDDDQMYRQRRITQQAQTQSFVSTQVCG